jgi:hypothetical protein
VALYRSGRQAEALRAFEAGRRVLADELGIDPSRELRDLEQRILDQDPSLDLPVWAAPEPAAPEGEIANPYKGLRPFSEADAGDFFGREALVGRLAERLDRERFLCLVGPSGSGKSSILHAGVLPTMRSAGGDRRSVAVMCPGNRPVEELEIVLARIFPDGTVGEYLAGGDDSGLRRALRVLIPEGGELLLVVDQAEELWTRTEEEQRDRFLGLLDAALEDDRCQLRLIAALRADRLGEALGESRLAGWLQAGVVVVPPLSPAELERAVAGPAERADVSVDRSLVAEVVADAADHPGALPALQFALTEAFAHRGGPSFTGEDYRSTGGIGGALARRAEEVYGALEATEQAAARQVVLRLVTGDGEAAGIRRGVPVAELRRLGMPAAALERILTGLGAARLVVFGRHPRNGDPTVEIAHEALLDHWERPAGWITGAQVDLERHRRLGELAADWEHHDRSADYLVSGDRLRRYTTLAGSTGLLLTDIERAFLDAGRRARLRSRVLSRGRDLGLAGVVATRLLPLGGVAAAAGTDEDGGLPEALDDLSGDAAELPAAELPAADGLPEADLGPLDELADREPDLGEPPEEANLTDLDGIDDEGG